ncbi:hypothetical protein FHE66_12695 [Georgenia sp. 311]|uniref:DNA-directed RNA polymerase subunit beta n=1 Tax=Georgenia wutianyii TaxID=2585135 RepID=A0ABX5VPG6_9MICO|nr:MULTISPECIES: hypothetical protein [Georgenia]QDB80394.1 hypothetical protein FE251_14155 [Georgenia wutianyii]TNC16909.1 hypothetical protein FHE66_12695 [Georgenia sp. 311]
MDGRDRPRRPAILDPAEAELIWGDSDPALASEAAHATANAVVFGPSHLAGDEPLAERVGRIIDAEGLDEIAGLWSRSPASTLPGALWRLYLLRAWLERDPETIATRFRGGTEHTTPVELREDDVENPRDAVVAPAPTVLGERLSQLFSGTDETELAGLLEEAAAFLRVLAAGTGSDPGWRTHDEEAAAPVTGRTGALTATAAELDDAAARARAGRLD